MNLLSYLYLTLLSTPLALSASASLDIKTTLTVPDAECTRKTHAGDNIHMHYRGTLASNNNEFDSSYNRGKPLVFPIGKGVVIRGWDEGLLDMCIGEKRTLTIPPEYGYGNRGIGPIPAGSTLVFETELVGIDGVEKKDEL